MRVTVAAFVAANPGLDPAELYALFDPGKVETAEEKEQR